MAVNALSPFTQLTELSPNQEHQVDKNQLKQADFLKLLIAQVNSQDPLNPKEGTEFLSQLAQFSTVDSVHGMNRSFEKFSNNFESAQTLQYTSLIGKDVYAEIDHAIVQDGLQGMFDLDHSQHALVKIFDEIGNQVHTIDCGFLAPGTYDWNWDGRDESGKQLTPGKFSVQAFGLNANGPETLDHVLHQRVLGVELNESQPLMTLADGQRIRLSKIKNIF